MAPELENAPRKACPEKQSAFIVVVNQPPAFRLPELKNAPRKACRDKQSSSVAANKPWLSKLDSPSRNAVPDRQLKTPQATPPSTSFWSLREEDTQAQILMRGLLRKTKSADVNSFLSPIKPTNVNLKRHDGKCIVSFRNKAEAKEALKFFLTKMDHSCVKDYLVACDFQVFGSG
ncbi:hypothetical protein DPMN_001783 [Dreissena polymorpha]|uniref:Uncharacterized protein n=1 Tax=Dreissena polymorpha TaxID=45954 RepID=A0A9D4RT89_DREPO|nr:hypothetical protein DPMN_001783 [Dreissena polymorpha]